MTRNQAIKDCILLLCGKLPPFPLRASRLSNLKEDQHLQLQSWLVNNLRMQWMTGIGTIEAIDHMVDEAVANSQLAFDQARPLLVETRK